MFITLEGPDGAGKSTQVERLVGRIRERGHAVVATREPGGTALGEQIRSVLLSTDADHDALTDALLFNAARRQLVREVIEPALAAGAVVVCDRFADSTLAYQGFGSGASLADLSALEAVATEGLKPGRTVLLDIPSEVAMERRMSGRVADLTRFETSAGFDLDFHRRVRVGFLEMARAEAQRWRLVDASRPVEEVERAIWEAIADLF